MTDDAARARDKIDADTEAYYRRMLPNYKLAPSHEYDSALLRRIDAAEARGRAAGRLDGINGFVKAILHGNDDHRKWLIDASIDFAAGNPVRALAEKEPHR